MAVSEKELIQAAIASGLIDHETVNTLRIETRKRQADLLDMMTVHGRFPLSAMYRALALSRGIPFVDPATTHPPENLIRLIPDALLLRRRILPVSEAEGSVLIATAEPDDLKTIEAVQRILGRPVRIGLSEPAALSSAIDSVLSSVLPRFRELSGKGAGDGPDPVTLMDQILKEAFLMRASDIHLDFQKESVRVRFRIDGRMQVFHSGLSRDEGGSLLSRVKVLAGLDIAEQRLPQDGGFSYSPLGTEAREIDIRVATVPTHWGERATLRLLGLSERDLSLEAIGMLPKDLSQFRSAISRPYGMILLTGPTGSGKTTTLYAALREINSPEVNIMTVEDPVEYVMDDISQVAVGDGKVTFASALRSLLRHDPDILMVGEIRDQETADVAMKAAMTGHLIFSTLHTNSACGAISRLSDIGCEPYLVGATLSAVVAQRLVRRLCPGCKIPRRANADEVSLLGLSDGTEVYDPVGCANCLGSGFRGQIGLFETLWIDDGIVSLISRGATDEEIRTTAREQESFSALREDGRIKIEKGVTTISEVLRVTTVRGG